MSVMNLEAIAAVIEDRKVRAAEYAKYRAKEDLFLDGVRYANAGDPVSTAAVEGGVRHVQDLEYDPSSGQHVGKVDKDNKAVTHPEKFPAVIERDKVYEVGGSDDPHMPSKPAPTEKKG